VGGKKKKKKERPCAVDGVTKKKKENGKDRSPVGNFRGGGGQLGELLVTGIRGRGDNPPFPNQGGKRPAGLVDPRHRPRGEKKGRRIDR